MKRKLEYSQSIQHIKRKVGGKSDEDYVPPSDEDHVPPINDNPPPKGSDDPPDDDFDVTSDAGIHRRLTKTIINRMLDELYPLENDDTLDISEEQLTEYLDKQEKLANDKSSSGDSLIDQAASKISSDIMLKIVSDIRKELTSDREFSVVFYLQDRLAVMEEIEEFMKNIISDPLQPEEEQSEEKDNGLKIIPLQELLKMFSNDQNEEEEPAKKKKKKVNKLDKEFLKFLNDGMFTPTDDYAYFKKLTNEEKQDYIDKIREMKNQFKVDKPKILKVIESSLSLNNKTAILNKLQKFDSLPPFSGEYFKLKNWVNGITRVPFGVYKKPPVDSNSSKSKIKRYMNKVKKHMDDAVFGHDAAKKQILQIIAHTISNPEEGGTIIAIQGPPGVGKTQLIQDGISKALQRPFEFISLGGATDSSFLEGHDYTYEGSQPGMIVEVLKKAKCMNPVIFFDELDKVSNTPKGHEIINILTHLTDLTQNHHFNEKYYTGIDFDLSKCIFIFSFNDEHMVNRILKDRMTVIRTKGFKVKDKIKIAQEYMIPKLLESVGFEDSEIIFSSDIIEYITEQYTFEGGVRKLKENLFEIIKEVNLRYLQGKRLLGKKIKFPLKVNKKMLTTDIFKKKYVIEHQKIHSEPKVGTVNGLWACDRGVGGLQPIEAFTIPTSTKLELELTGMQGDVMKESMKCAKTVAWNIISDSARRNLNDQWKNFGNSGIHIHCPDGSTPIEGPSAGAAITTAIISLLMKEKISNTIAMTGEINLKGQICQIGGLSEKLNGAKKAGVVLVLVPKDNERDLNKILANEPNLIDDSFNVVMVSDIWQVLQHVFVNNVDVKKY